MAAKTLLGADDRHTTPPVMIDAQVGQVHNDSQAAEPHTRDPKCPRRLEIPNENMTPFKGRQDVLRNFYPCKIKGFECIFNSSEHEYQFMKAKF